MEQSTQPTVEQEVAARVNEYVNRRTATGSAEAAVQNLVRRAVRAGIWYLRQFDVVGDDDVLARELAAAEALASAASEATYGELTDVDIVVAAQMEINK